VYSAGASFLNILGRVVSGRGLISGRERGKVLECVEGFLGTLGERGGLDVFVGRVAREHWRRGAGWGMLGREERALVRRLLRPIYRMMAMQVNANGEYKRGSLEQAAEAFRKSGRGK
jgi:hypothetical protein